MFEKQLDTKAVHTFHKHFSRDKKVDNNKRILNSIKLNEQQLTKTKTMILFVLWLGLSKVLVDGSIMNHGGVPYAISNPEGRLSDQ